MKKRPDMENLITKIGKVRRFARKIGAACLLFFFCREWRLPWLTS